MKRESAPPSAAGRGNWGRWGADDERGATNLLDDAALQRGLRAAKGGRTYSLGIPVQPSGVPNAVYRAPSQRFTTLNQTDTAFFSALGVPEGVVWNEDVLMMATHGQTHIDALCHVTDGGLIYNGFRGDDISAVGGATRCGIEKMPPILTRGILLDVPRALGFERLPLDHVITIDNIEASLEFSALTIEPGDAVLVRTGWLEGFLDGSFTMEGPQPGVGSDAAVYLAEKDVALVGGDNSSLEPFPFENGRVLGVHRDLLVTYGVPIIEHLRLDGLSRDQHRSFLFIALPLPITGATGSPINPLAVV